MNVRQSIAAGLRLLVLAAALAFAGAARSQPTITAVPDIRAPNYSTLATWSGISSPTSSDRIELHAVGSSTVIAWQYTGGAASGSLYFWIPDTVAHGTYELWLRRYTTHVATSNPITVSMMVAGPVTLGGSAFAGVTLSATNGAFCTQTSASGQYSCSITSGWSGEVTPSKPGYIFTPASRSYVNLTSTQTAQGFTAAVSRVISGSATLNGLPLANVAFSASGGWSCTTSDAQGSYSCTVPDGWTGSITPSQTGYSFSPSSRSYSTGVVADDPGEDYAASLSSPTSDIAFVHVDHLNTPRLVSDASGTTVWRWEQMEPFGVNAADEDPDGNSTLFEMPLRYPGQYRDKETNLHYNYHRDYDPGNGRFSQSDPIGLLGGLNTYAYVGNDPLDSYDTKGLARGRGERGQAASPKGTPNEFKHMKPHPKDPTKVIFTDPRTGKKIEKAKPEGFDEAKAKKLKKPSKVKVPSTSKRSVVGGAFCLSIVVACVQGMVNDCTVCELCIDDYECPQSLQCEI